VAGTSATQRGSEKKRSPLGAALTPQTAVLVASPLAAKRSAEAASGNEKLTRRHESSSSGAPGGGAARERGARTRRRRRRRRRRGARGGAKRDRHAFAIALAFSPPRAEPFGELGLAPGPQSMAKP
jgi:hypothetical protein